MATSELEKITGRGDSRDHGYDLPRSLRCDRGPLRTRARRRRRPLLRFSAMQGGGRVIPRRDVPTGKPPSTVPAILFHGDRDKTVHPRNADHLLTHHRAGTPVSAPRVTTSRGQVPGGHAYTHVAYHAADGRAIVERWTVHGLGHAWSGGSVPGSDTDPRGPDASAEMVEFFHQHPRREPVERPTD
jgi:poly(3-hydroxybutyrate) depolymerase